MININKEINLPSNKKEIDHHDKMTYWPTSIKEVINWFPFLDIMKYIADRIYNQITLLPSLLKMFTMLQMSFWYDKEPDDQNDMKVIAISCNNCGKETDY